MSTVATIETLKSTLDNRVVRFFLKKFSGRCGKDGLSRVEVALELLVGARDEACFTCSHLVKPIVKWAVFKGAKAFDLSEDDIRKAFDNVYKRRGLVNVLRGISKFGVKRPFVPGAPFLVVWNFTWKCNLRCKHCYACAGAQNRRELSEKEALKALKEFADAGVNIIALSGGEPLMRKDVYDIIKTAHDYGMYTAIATNATLITKEVALKLKNAGLGYVQASLDGASPETHDSFRGVPGVFERTVKGIRNCVEAGLFVEVSSVITKYNYKEVEDIIKLSGELGANWWMMYNFVPTGRGKNIVEADLSPEEREEVLRKLWNILKSRKYKVDVLSTAPQYARVAIQCEKELSNNVDKLIVPTHFYNPELQGKLISLSEFIGGCGAGRFYCAMDPDGAITPCVFMPLKVGNITEDNFEELWESNKVFNDLRDRDSLKEHCGVCEYRYVCGGCRARAYNYLGDYMGPDPGCVNNLDVWKKIVLGERVGARQIYG